MAAHWHSDGVTIFTAIGYYRAAPGEPLQHKSFAIVSDELTHDKHAVYRFNQLIIQHIQELVPWPCFDKVQYWSDDAAS